MSRLVLSNAAREDLIDVWEYHHILFYVIASDRIEIVRILHGARDLPAAFSEPSPSPTPHDE